MSDFDKPSRAEDEYFAKQELERRKKWAQEQAAKMAVEEKENLKKAHWMKCPKCGYDLETIKWRKVDVEKCFRCGVVVLDDGELETLAGDEHPGGFVHSFKTLFKG